MTSLAYALIILLLLSVAACTGSAQEEETTTIIDVIGDNENFVIIAGAFNNSSLNAVLTGNETHTVFLPTDQAFENMSEDAFEELIADPSALEQVLLYHVANGTLMTEDLANVSNVTTLQGSQLPVNVTDEGIFVGDAEVTQANITADNGVIHVIDTVLIPPEGPAGENDIIETATQEGNFTTFLLAVGAANLTEDLKGEGPYTIFAPTDEAFNALPDGTIEALLNDTGTLTETLHYHMTDGRLMAEDLANMTNITTHTGDEIPVNVTQEGILVGNARIVVQDINASNGVIHAIDAVLIPEEAVGGPVELYNDTVSLTEGNFTFTPENSTQNYTVDNFTDIGTLNATGLQYNVSIVQNGNVTNETNATNMSVLQDIEGIRNNNTTGERWFVYINGTEAEEDFGMNPVTNGTNLSFWYATEENGEAVIENATYVANITVAIEEEMEPEPGGPEPEQNLTVLYNDTVNLTEGNFTFTPENDTQSYEINNLTDFGALNATGLQYNVSVLRAETEGNMTGNMTENMTGNITEVAFVLDGIAGIESDNETGETWFVYINDEPAEEIFGMNNLSDGDNLSFWYTTQEGGEAAIENATYVANITVAAEGEMEPQPGQNLTELYNDTVNLTEGNIVFRPGTALNYTIDNLTDFGALYATGLNFTASLTQNVTGNATGNMTNVSFILESIEEVENNNATGEMWFVYINGEPAEEDFGMNNVSDGDNLSFWYTTEEGGEAAIENATYVANITVAAEGEMEPQPGQNLTLLYNDTVNLTEGNFTFTPENSTQNYTVDNFTDIGALNATGLQYNVSIFQNGNATNETNATNMTNMSVLEGIEGIRNNNTTGEKWFVYINGTQAEEDFGMNPVTNGTNLSFWYATEENGEAAIENATYAANITVAIEEEMEPEPGPETGQDLTELYNDTVNLTEGNFTFTPENDTQSYEINNLTDFGALNATGLQYNVSVLRALTGGNVTGNMTGNATEVAFVLDSIEGIENNNETGERWFTYVNGEPAEQIFGMNNISDGDDLSFWYTTQEGGEASIENATYVANITVTVEEEMEPEPEPEPGQNRTVLYNDTVNLTAGNFTLRPENSTLSYRINNFTDLGALSVTGLDFNVSLMQNMTGNMTGNTTGNMTGNMTGNITDVPFTLQSIEGIRNNNTAGERWFVYINGKPAEENFGMNKVNTGDNLSFWYTTQEGGESSIENATYAVNITVAELRVRANIVPAAQNQTNLTTFVSAVQTANLTQTLNGTGPYTVCIPSNEAFNKLPAGTRNQLMNNTTLLRQVLSYHVVSGSYTYEQLIRANNVTNIQGNVLQVNAVGNNITIQNVNVTQIIVVNNGVICIIDEVLIPPGGEIPSGNQTDGNQTDGNQTGGNLTGDWYFFSIPFEANNTSVDHLLADVNYTSLIYYNASTKLFENISNIEPLKAYWINVPNGTEFNASEQFSSVEKKQITAPPSLQVYPGWNALGSPVNETVPAEAAFITLNNSSLNNSFAKIVGPWVPGNNTTGYYRYVGYNGLNGTIGENQLGADEFEVEPYEGYWVFIRQEYLYG